MGSDGFDETTSRGPEPKVQRVIREYQLEGMEDELVTRWRGKGGSRRSLRDLAADLNMAILKATISHTELRPLEGEIENLYRLLVAEDVGEAQRTEAEAKLERYGIDVDSLQTDFVSHQAVHTYLKDNRGVRLPESDNDEILPHAAETIQRISGRLQSITERTLERLNGDYLSLGDPDVFVSVQVYCEGCGQQFELNNLLQRGGCKCEL